MSEYSLTTASNLFKIKYLKLSENTYNSANVILGRVKKSYKFVGSKQFVSVPLGFSGGVGSGSLPTAGVGKYEDALITAKKVYGVCQVEREAIKASQTSEGAFVEMTKESVKKTVESYMRNYSRILFGTGDGSLGAGDGVTNVTGNGTTGTPYLVTISAASWKEANWEESDLVNVGVETTLLEVVAVDPATKVVSLVGASAILAAAAAGPTATSAVIYMQKSKDNDPIGLKGVCDATSGSLYTIPVQRRWKSYQAASAGAGITTDMLNKDTLAIQQRCGKAPKMIVTSYAQFGKILNLLEDQKEYMMDPRASELKGKISFRGVEFMTSAGAIPLFPERFCDDDRVYYINDDMIEIHHRPDFGWFDDDGTVFLRKDGADSYEARYGGYMENYIVPSFQGVRTGLAV